MQIFDYDAEVKINSTVIPDWSAFSVRQALGDAEIEASVDIKRPISISDGDTLSIRDGMGGALFDLVVDKEIEIQDGTISDRTIVVSGSTISRKGPPIHHVWVNESWLNEVAVGYVYKNGLLYWRNFTTDSQVNGVSQYRIMFLDGVPGRDTKDHEFTCHVQSGITHHDIIRWLADQCGLSLVINTPNLAVQKTFTLYSSEKYWDAIRSMVAKWNPLMFVRDDTLYIFDAGSDTQAKNSNTCLELTEDSFSLYRWSTQKVTDIVDHILIRGPSTRFTYQSKNLNIAKQKRTAVNLSGEEETYVTEEDITDGNTDDSGYEYMKLYTVSEVKAAKIKTTTTKKRDPNNPSNLVTTYEKIEMWNTSDVQIKKVETTYEYADFNTPVSETTNVWALCMKTATGSTETIQGEYLQELPDTDFLKIETQTVEYMNYLNDLGAVEINVTTENLCVGLKTKQKKDDEEYWVLEAWYPITESTNIGHPHYEEKDDDEGYYTAWLKTYKRMIRYDMSSGNHLRKWTMEFRIHPYPQSKIRKEDIPLPDRRSSLVNERVWEFFKTGEDSYILYDGTNMPSGQFHPRLEMYEPDVVTQADAEKIAKRMFKKRGETITRAVIQFTFPIPALKVGCPVKLPACSKQYYDYTTQQFETVNIPEITLWGIEHTRSVQFVGSPGASNRGINFNDTLQLSEYY